MSGEGGATPVDSDEHEGFSDFLQAIASAPPPERAFSPGEQVLGAYWIERPLRRAPRMRAYLASSADGEVCLVRLEVAAERSAELQAGDLRQWAARRLPAQAREGTLEVREVGLHRGCPVVVCSPIPAESLQAWLQDGPHSRAEVHARLGALVRALAWAHGEGITGFALAPEAIWLGLDGHARLSPPTQGPGDADQECALLRALVVSALPQGRVRDRIERDAREGRGSLRRLGARLARTRRLGPPALVVGGAVLCLSAVAWFAASSSSSAPSMEAALAAETPAVAEDPAFALREQLGRAEMLVDVGSPQALAVVRAYAREGADDPSVAVRAAVLRMRMARERSAYFDALQDARSTDRSRVSPSALARLEVAQGLDALERGELREALEHRRIADELVAGAEGRGFLELQVLRWRVDASMQSRGVASETVRAQLRRRSPPSLSVVLLRAALADVLAAQGQLEASLREDALILQEPMAPRWVRLDRGLARVHRLLALGRVERAQAALGALEADTPGERAALALADAAVARHRADEASALASLRRAEVDLAQADRVLALDLTFEHATWSMRAGHHARAREALAEALADHDRIRGATARSRLPLERAFAQAKAAERTLTLDSPPSRAVVAP